MSCRHAGNQNSYEVPLSSTGPNWLYFCTTSVSAITVALLSGKSQRKPRAWNSVLLRFSTQPIVLIYRPPNFKPGDRSDAPASCRSQRFTLHSLDSLHPSQTAIDHSCTADTHTSASMTVSKAWGNPENPCVTASIWLHPDSASVSFSEQRHRFYIPLSSVYSTLHQTTSIVSLDFSTDVDETRRKCDRVC